MSDLNNKLLDAIEILAKRMIETANFNKTIKATIVQPLDESIGEYEVSYQGANFSAFVNSTDTKYAKGNNVYILLPNGDFNTKKYIQGLVENASSAYNTTITDAERFELTGKNIIENFSQVNLVSGKESIIDLNNNIQYINEQELQDYMSNAEAVRVSFTLQTNLDQSQRAIGDFGISIGLGLGDFDIDKIGTEISLEDLVNTSFLNFGTSLIGGNPYNVSSPTRQTHVFNLKNCNISEILSIKAYTKDFLQETENEDIFISNLSIEFGKLLSDEEMGRCKMNFLTPQGIYFTDDTSSDKTITAQIKAQGKLVDTSKQSIDFYWFKEDVRVNKANEFYNNYGGVGWKCLNEHNVITEYKIDKYGNYELDDDNEMIISKAYSEWSPSGATIILNKDNNASRTNRYKCVALYDENTILTEYFELYNMGYDASLSLVPILIEDLTKEMLYDTFNYAPSAGGHYYDNGIILGFKALRDGILDQFDDINSEYSYHWSVSNFDGKLIIDSSNSFEKEFKEARDKYLTALSSQKNGIDETNDSYAIEELKNKLNMYAQKKWSMHNILFGINTSAIDTQYTVKCGLYKGDSLIDTASFDVINAPESENGYKVVIQNGNRVYNYDVDGNSPVGPHGTNTPPDALDFIVYNSEGIDITEEIKSKAQSNWRWVAPNNSMIIPNAIMGEQNDDTLVTSYVNEDKFIYTIAETYNNELLDNTVILKINYAGNNLEARTNFIFIKDGEQGTNGTAFTCKLSCNNPVITIRGIETPDLPQGLKTELYRNGSLEPFDSYTQEYMMNENINEPSLYKFDVDGNFVLNLPEGLNEEDFENYFVDNDFSNVLKTEITRNVSKEEQENGEIPGVILGGIQKYSNLLPLVTVYKKSSEYDFGYDLSSGFTWVTYSSEGKSPQYLNRPFKIYVMDDEGKDISDHSDFSFEWRTTKTGEKTYTIVDDENNSKEVTEIYHNVLSIVETKGNSATIKPALNYDGRFTNTGIVCTIKHNNNILGYIHIAVAMVLDQTNSKGINGWDGTSIALNEDEGTIVAPQVGAGYKNAFNQFTGVLIGTNVKGDESRTGLMAYAEGKQTAFLNAEDGSIILGSSNEEEGQILISPKQVSKDGKYTSVIKGKNLELNMTEGIIRGGGTDENDSVFYLTAEEGKVSHIGNWYVNGRELYTQKGDAKFILGYQKPTDEPYNVGSIIVDPIILASDGRGTNTFAIQADGALYASKAQIANGSKIGGWTVGERELYSGSTPGSGLILSPGGGNTVIGQEKYVELDNNGDPILEWNEDANSLTLKYKTKDITESTGGYIKSKTNNTDNWYIMDGSAKIGGWILTTEGMQINSGGKTVIKKDNIVTNKITVASMEISKKSLAEYIKGVITKKYLTDILDKVYSEKGHSHTVSISK